MPELVDLIEKNLSRFKVAPIGPVGSHVELARGKHWKFSSVKLLFCKETKVTLMSF
jgi:hypothetical protein